MMLSPRAFLALTSAIVGSAQYVTMPLIQHSSNGSIGDFWYALFDIGEWISGPYIRLRRMRSI